MQFINPDGYWLRSNLAATIEQGKQMYDFTLDLEDPLSFFDDEFIYQPNRKQTTDLGSVPRFVQGIRGFGKDDWEIAFLFHDAICKHGGLWVAGEFVKIPRKKGDRLLRDMIKIEAKLKKKKLLGAIVKWPIWLGVRIGAWMGIGGLENNN